MSLHLHSAVFHLAQPLHLRAGSRGKKEIHGAMHTPGEGRHNGQLTTETKDVGELFPCRLARLAEVGTDHATQHRTRDADQPEKGVLRWIRRLPLRLPHLQH
jgi:hypothetical protein